MMVVKEYKDDKFYCEVNYPAPGGETRMTETERINITVYCEFGCSLTRVAWSVLNRPESVFSAGPVPLG